ncbi:mucin-4-like [Physella acuta]|uniref:mucin-4-like n=1 Tax=Physella acuta TaxID=109671 RepID=UPI0027DCEAE5|nr:mucin-4-like [Physella acuta]XP_059177000.1 mucin-4-like [Physella acuta]
MATGTRLMEEISNQFLNCKICLENFQEPKTLSCLHTFCCECLQKQYEEETVSRTSRFSIYNRNVTCPLCRKKTELPTGGVRRLPDNFLVSSLTQVVAKRKIYKIPACEICINSRSKNVDACNKCLDCGKLLCKRCVDLHLSTKVTQQHSLIDIEGEKDIQCKSHPDENVRFYCDPCDACICVVCAFQEHRDHEVCSFSDGSVKYRCRLESLLGLCKERVDQVSTRLHVIDKYETQMKHVKESIRDLAISYIAQVRAKERELMKLLEESDGDDIKNLVNQKSALQENLDELQNTCNLTDIMLKDRGVELLLVKKEMEDKMGRLLEPILPDLPSDSTYDVQFVPGVVALGRLSFGLDKGKEKENLKDVEKEIFSIENFSKDPDVLSNCTQTDKSRTKEESTSMLSDMKEACHISVQTDHLAEVCHALSQTDPNVRVIQRTETREKGITALILDTKSKGTMTERSDVRSLKCQTDLAADQPPATLSSPTLSASSSTSDVTLEKSSSFFSRAPAPDLLPSSAGMTPSMYATGRKIRSVKSQTEFGAKEIEELISLKDAAVVVSADLKSTSALAPENHIRKTDLAENEKNIVKIPDEKGGKQNSSSKARDGLGDKITTRDKVATTDREVSTVSVAMSDRATGTCLVKMGDAGCQVTPRVNVVSTNTPLVQKHDQGCLVDIVATKPTTAQAVPEKPAVTAAPKKTCDKASDPIKIPYFSKATETLKVKTSSSSTETTSAALVDKDTSTSLTKTVDQWTETPAVQMISTGVTSPVPATLDVGVATNVVLTDEQATSTDVRAYRDSHTETVLVVCDSETLTDAKLFADAQTAVDDDRRSESLDPVDTTQRRPGLQLKQQDSSKQKAMCVSCGVRAKDENTKSPQHKLPAPAGAHHTKEDTAQHPINTQDVGTMAISCLTTHLELQEAGTQTLSELLDRSGISCQLLETAIQTSHPQLYDKASATSLDLELGLLGRHFCDAATSTESLPYIGLLSEIDVDELIVVPEAAFELVSDTDSEPDVVMVDDETATDFVQLVESGTLTDDFGGDSMTESNSSKGVGEIIRSLVQAEGGASRVESKHLVSIGVNTATKLTFEKETCTPIRHLFSKGTMTFYVSKMDKSTSTQARVMTGHGKVKAEDKATMTREVAHKNAGTETYTASMDGKITACISKLRNVSERLNSPPEKKSVDVFFNKTFNTPAADEAKKCDQPPLDAQEDKRQSQLKTLLDQTNAVLKSPTRKAQPITTLKCRKPAINNKPGPNLKPEEPSYKSQSLPRAFSSDRTGTVKMGSQTLTDRAGTVKMGSQPLTTSERTGTVKMGSQPLSSMRLPLLRYNSAPGRIATVPSHPMKSKTSPLPSPKVSRIPITKKLSPPDYISKPTVQTASVDTLPEAKSPKPQVRRPLPSITETRTPSSCSDASTVSHTSVGSLGATHRLSSGSSLPVNSGVEPEQRLSVGPSVTPPPRSPSVSTAFSTASDSCPESILSSTGSAETLHLNPEEKSTKKQGLGFMQRFLSKKKKSQDDKKKEPLNVVKSGPTTASAVAALASATPPLPAPPPESHAHINPQFPPHHYPPPPEPKSPPPPRKPRPFVYVRQRIFAIQQDNVEDVEEKKLKSDEKKPTAPEAATPQCEPSLDKNSQKTKSGTKKDEKNSRDKTKKAEGSKSKSSAAKKKTKKTDAKEEA